METALKIFSVAVGGAVGAVARYLINISPISSIFAKFPLHTFLINIVGSFLIGFLLVIFSERASSNENLRLAIIVGFLGAFTTFSTFEFEIYELLEARMVWSAFLYLFLSVLVGFIGVTTGFMLGRRI
ncbi:MAG TPA: fluoride efflux transporter CrcB [Pyrinomonadaceae bacterium]|jgi:CrcB protein|nr:fluoride efflux transporter CrcB [Pyrinomonadaceae bacterium]